MNFCSHCGAAVRLETPPGDHLPRHICPDCGMIHYLNPKLVVGCVVEWQGHILLCRRAIEPRSGLWTLPAGFMENNETTAQAAARETWEEAGARIDMGPLFSLIDVPHISQVHLFYRGTLIDGTHAPGIESLETALVAEDAVPWEQIAFRSVGFTLRAYFADRRSGRFGMHTTSLPPPPAG